MSRRRDLDDEPSLFDLPLDGPAILEEDREPGPAGWQPVEEDEAAGASTVTGAPRDAAPPEPALLPPVPPTAPAAGGRREPAPLSSRFLAGLADLAVHLALAVALLFGSRLLGVEAGLGDWPALVLFLLVFSFLYTVLPLAFWGQTPGMAWAGLVARARG
ncbi:MAG TPA: RDD family protein, partial [Thermoanaerobaculia bacterium]|nr:RDD family protein [Thermoanaerobaculia bacterium]